MGLKGGGAALVGVQVFAAKANAAGRWLYEGEEARPGGGRSDLAYMQHKYTPLDSRIIIITAAILLLLLSILFLNFFIRWALCRFFLLRSQKPINPNKGLSKRQVQALPSFIYSSSKPPLPCHLIPSAPCAHPKFYPSFLPFTPHGDTLKPISSFCSTKLDAIDYHLPTKFEVLKGDHKPPSQFEVPKGDHNPSSQLISTQVDDVDSDPTAKFGSPEVNQLIAGNDSPTKKGEVVNNANSIISSTKSNVHTTHCEVKGNSPTFKGDNHIIDCTKTDEMANHGDDNASSPTPCPICLIDFADGDTIRVLPACGHYFHIGCIDLWLAKSSSCPACRANLLEASRPQPTLQVHVVTTNSL